MTSSLSFSHLFRTSLVIVADRDHNMLVVWRHPGGQIEDRTSSLQHGGPQEYPPALELSFYNSLFLFWSLSIFKSVCISGAINKSLAICYGGEFQNVTSL